MAAFDITNTKPYPKTSFSLTDSERTGFTFDPDYGNWFDVNDFNLDALNLSDSVLNSVYNPAVAKDTTTAINSTNQILGDFLGGLKAKAGKQAFWGGTIKTAASAANLFTNILAYSGGRKTAEMQADNKRLQAQVQMDALDNQVLHFKTELMDRFNALVSRNIVTAASKGLRVSGANILEQSKETAHDMSEDMRTMESNAELKKIALRSEARQADIVKGLQKNLLAANLVKGMADLGLMVSTGGGTFQNWGDLWANAGFGSDSGSLNKTVYGGK